MFEYAYRLGTDAGYDVTSSVFDTESLDFLLEFDVPFIKLANRPEYRALAKKIPRLPVMISYSNSDEIQVGKNIIPLCCVSSYPASVKEYHKNFDFADLQAGVSDHTEGLNLYKIVKPAWWEKHYVLERGGDNPDAGVFAMVPEDLEEL